MRARNAPPTALGSGAARTTALSSSGSALHGALICLRVATSLDDDAGGCGGGAAALDACACAPLATAQFAVSTSQAPPAELLAPVLLARREREHAGSPMRIEALRMLRRGLASASTAERARAWCSRPCRARARRARRGRRAARGARVHRRRRRRRARGVHRRPRAHRRGPGARGVAPARHRRLRARAALGPRPARGGSAHAVPTPFGGDPWTALYGPRLRALPAPPTPRRHAAHLPRRATRHDVGSMRLREALADIDVAQALVEKGTTSVVAGDPRALEGLTAEHLADVRAIVNGTRRGPRRRSIGRVRPDEHEPGPSTAASRIDVDAARRAVARDRALRRARMARRAVAGGLAALLVCIGLVAGAAVSTSMRAAKADELHRAWRVAEAELGCAGEPRRFDGDDGCAAAVDALVASWREARAPVPLFERVGALLAAQVGIGGIGHAPGNAWRDEVERAVRRSPLARARAGLPSLGAPTDAWDARLQIEEVPAEVLAQAGAAGRGLLVDALDRMGSRDAALAAIFGARARCMRELAAAARTPTTGAREDVVEGSLAGALACVRALDGMREPLDAAARASERAAQTTGTAVALASALYAMRADPLLLGELTDDVIAAGVTHDERGVEALRVLRQAAARASLDVRAPAWRAARRRAEAADATSRILVALAFAGAQDAVAHDACDDALALVVRDAERVSMFAHAAPDLGCAQPRDLLARLHGASPSTSSSSTAAALAALYGPRLLGVALPPGDDKRHADAARLVTEALDGLDDVAQLQRHGMTRRVSADARATAGLDGSARSLLRALVNNER